MAFLSKKTERYFSFLFADDELKIAKLDRSGKKLTALFQFPLPEGLVVEGGVADIEKLARFLIQVKNKTKIGSCFAVVGIPEIRASTHSLTLPAISVSEIDQAIKLQAESFLPFPYKNEYLDWMLVGKTADQSNRVLLSAVPKKIINDFVESFQKADLKPVAFETTSLSLFRLLPPEGKKRSFAAEIGKTSVVLILGNEGNIEACSVVKEPDLFLETAKKMRSFYLEKEGAEKGQKIYLCGKNLSEQVINNIKNELSIDPVILKTAVAGIPSGKENELAILVSLARKEVSLPEDVKTINVLPDKLAKKYQSFYKGKRADLLAFLFALLVLLLNLASAFSYFKIKDQYRDSFSRIDPSYPRLDPNSTEFSAWLKKARTVNKVSAGDDFANKVIKTLLEFSYQNVEIFGFDFNPEKDELILTGRAKKRDDVLKLKEGLEEEDFVAKASIPVSSLEQEENAEFRIKLFLERVL
ncbi:MAG: pilus assembly protein PilM [Patescibacteria group bacterium]